MQMIQSLMMVLMTRGTVACEKKSQRIAKSFYNVLLQSDGEDELKKRQLMELAIINGTYRDSSSKNSSREFRIFLSDPSPIIGNACHSLTHSLTD